MFVSPQPRTTGSPTPAPQTPLLGVEDVEAFVEELRSGLDRDVDDAERVTQLQRLEALKSVVAAAQARISVDFAASQRAAQEAAGLPSRRVGEGIAAQVGLARRESPHRGSQLLRVATALVAQLPGTYAALQQGLLNEWRATLIVRETGCLSGADRAGVDAELWADPARTAAMGDAELAAKVRALAYRTDPEAFTARAAKARSDRCVTLRPAPDTMTYLTGLLPVEQGVAAYAALRKAADAARAAGDPRTRGQVMADTLVERLTGQGSAEAVPVRVELVMTDDTLLAGGDEPALVPGYGPIPAGLARDLVGDAIAGIRAWCRRVYTHPGTGRLVGLEADTRLFPPGLADFLDLRDHICRTPWCGAPIRHHDHQHPHRTGGPTSAVNGQGVCETCSYTKEAPGWQTRPGPDGTITLTTPTRHTYPSPEPRPPGWHPPHPPVNATPAHSPPEPLILELYLGGPHLELDLAA